MNKQEKIEAIRQKCIEANPEIVELKFGCIFEHTWCGEKTINIISSKPEPSMNQILLRVPTIDGNTWDFEIPFQKEYKILGRPIRLADVLLAIGKKQEIKPRLELWSVQLEMMFTRNERNNAMWNLLKDSLSDQSSECIDFLYELLKQ